MKFTFRPLFGSKKPPSRSDPSSLSYGSSSSSSSSDASVNLKETPKSVLQPSYFPTDHLRWDIVEVFKLLDKDGDGKISRHEVELIFHQLGVDPPSQEEVTMMLSEADLDGDGCISLDEFGALSSTLGPAREPDLRDAFDYFDTDSDGKISADELLHVFSTLGDEGCTLEDCRRMVAGVDKEGKGFVCFEDFERMMQVQETRRDEMISEKEIVEVV